MCKVNSVQTPTIWNASKTLVKIIFLSSWSTLEISNSSALYIENHRKRSKQEHQFVAFATSQYMIKKLWTYMGNYLARLSEMLGKNTMSIRVVQCGRQKSRNVEVITWESKKLCKRYMDMFAVFARSKEARRNASQIAKNGFILDVDSRNWKISMSEKKCKVESCKVCWNV